LAGWTFVEDIHVSDLDRKDSSACGGGCPKCSAVDQCGQQPGGLSGWVLVASSACVFLLPLAAAAAGAVLAGPERTHQFYGAFGGLAAGLLAGAIAARLIGRTAKEKV
jgi:predicted lipid-binding transport protein (Tim44 family)